MEFTKQEQEQMLERRRSEMESVKKTILEGRIYAKVESVSKSGMSRRISFYRVGDEKAKWAGDYYTIENITPQVAWLTGWVKVGEYKQGDKYLNEDGLKVSGCGMDMIFHTLYTAIDWPKAEAWNQNYNRL